jgi:hypothetical protein
MNLAYNAELSKYECVVDTARGEVRFCVKEAGLQWQWYDRREKLVKDTVRSNNYPESTFERVDVPVKCTNRIVFTCGPRNRASNEMLDARC